MICVLVENVMDLHAQGRLLGSQSRWIEGHLSRCARCAAELVAWKRTFRELRSLPALSAPEDRKAQLRSAARELARERAIQSTESAGWWPRQPPSIGFAFGVAAFALSISASIFGPGLPSQSCSNGEASVCVSFSGSAGSGIRTAR